MVVTLGPGKSVGLKFRDSWCGVERGKGVGLRFDTASQSLLLGFLGSPSMFEPKPSFWRHTPLPHQNSANPRCHLTPRVQVLL
ncbi:hypothetical protein Nepgr_011131 [Nepenthes gracilis]|uniref:Uncharacterized protein n=1 Tax=Nepenthes gracilis TaxID=150966 RepID=A0AAD3SDI3_NEPGR|nr:hypothetical protein Nepgr_011131 [Nepenthes gracilis]